MAPGDLARPEERPMIDRAVPREARCMPPRALRDPVLLASAPAAGRARAPDRGRLAEVVPKVGPHVTVMA